MIRRIRLRPLLFAATMAVVSTVVSACADRSSVVGLEGVGVHPDAATNFEVSDADARPGDDLVLGIKVRAKHEAVGGVQGTLLWDPDKLELLGHVPEGQTVVALNRTGPGVMHVLAVHPRGLDRSGVLAFRILAPGWQEEVLFDPEAVVGVSEQEYLGTPGARLMVADDLPSGRTVQAVGPVPGAGVFVHPDVERSWGGDDVLLAVVAAMEDRDDLRCVFPRGPRFEECMALNVRPVNGRVVDSLPPGIEPDGTAKIDILDVLAIALESACSSESCREGVPIVGEERMGWVAWGDGMEGVVAGDGLSIGSAAGPPADLRSRPRR